MATALLVSVGGPSFNRQLPKQFPGRLPIAASPTRPRARGGLKRVNALPPTQPRGLFFCLCRARRTVDAGFQADAFRARPVEAAWKIWRPTAVQTFFEGPE